MQVDMLLHVILYNLCMVRAAQHEYSLQASVRVLSDSVGPCVYTRNKDPW